MFVRSGLNGFFSGGLTKLSDASAHACLQACFMVMVSTLAAFGFTLYGGRLFVMLRQFPVQSPGRRKKLKEVRDPFPLISSMAQGPSRNGQLVSRTEGAVVASILEWEVSATRRTVVCAALNRNQKRCHCVVALCRCDSIMMFFLAWNQPTYF